MRRTGHSSHMRFWAAIGLALGAGAPALAAEATAAAAPSALAAEPQPAITDASITADIRAQLDKVKLLKTARIAVGSSNGVVTLTGTVPSDFARERALEIARATPGVVRVDDYLRLDISAPDAPAPY